MRAKLRRLRVGSLVALVVLGAASAQADFNPFGRRAGKRPSGSHPAASTPTRRAPKKTVSAAHGPAGQPPSPESADSSGALIERYTSLAVARPGEPFPLDRLVELYRKRDGNLDRLIADLEARAAKPRPERYAVSVALGGVLARDAKPDRARAVYERAIAASPKNPIAVLALARLLESTGDKEGAKARYEAALPDVRADADREQLLHTLMGLTLDLHDYDGARRYHDEIVRRAKGSFFARSELGRELFNRGEFARAEAEQREVLKASSGDNRALAPALRDLGVTLARESKTDEALDVFRRALAATGGQSGLRRALMGAMADVYRSKGRVAELVTLLEKEHPSDFERLVLLGSLYEETGRVADALAAYRRALGRRDDIATRLKVVQLLEVEGKLDDAIHEYERLIRASPHDASFVFRLTDTLIQRGDRKRALSELQALEARSAGDDDTLSSLVQYYEHIGEGDRAAILLDRLAKAGGSDPRHLVELGDHYYQQGDTKRAVEIWQRIRVVVPDRARALHALGEVLLDHDMADDALASLRQAVELAPREVKYLKALALALERIGTSAAGSRRAADHEEARQIWEKVLRTPTSDAVLRREARQHIVTIWGIDGRLPEHTGPLERRLKMAPPDLESGKLLAEAYSRLRRPADAERVLRFVVAREPGEPEAYLALERALVSERKLKDAIAVLKHLVTIDGRRAREYYERMAQYSTELYRDDDAIKWASKAVELSPEDADGHRKLGEMYRRHQETDRAIDEFRRALAKNDRLFPVYFDLADLLLTRGDVDEADRLLRRVIRASPDDDLVARAARLSMQVNLGRGTVESLERELLPIALGNPARPVFRRLLIEIYGNLAFPLVHEARSADPKIAAAARAKLHDLGERAVKPLLDALADDRGAEQRTAVELLSHVSNTSAGPALISFATGSADVELRTRAMLAASSLDDPAMLPRLEAVLAPAGNVRVDEANPVALAAAFGVARMKSEKAHGALVRMLSSDAPSIRALAAVGLGLLGNSSDVRVLSDVAASNEHESLERAAAAFSLGALGAGSASPVLARLAEASDPLLRGAAVLALARVHAPSAKRLIASGLVAADPSLRAESADAALVFTTREFRAPSELLPVPDGRLDVRAVVAGLRPSGYTPDERARAVSELEPELSAAAVAAVESGPDGARVVADAVLARAGKPAFAPLTDGLDGADPAALARTEKSLDAIADPLAEPFVALSRHPSPEVRARAIAVLGTRSGEVPERAVVAALDDPDSDVQRAALSVVSLRDPGAFDAVTRLATKAPAWAVREHAAEALAAVVLDGPRTDTADAAVAVLATIAEHDAIAFVRESAVRVLGRAGSSAARASLRRVAASDAEPRVRLLATSMLTAAKPPAIATGRRGAEP